MPVVNGILNIPVINRFASSVSEFLIMFEKDTASNLQHINALIFVRMGSKTTKVT